MPEASEACPAPHQSATYPGVDTARAAVDWRPGASDAGGERGVPGATSIGHVPGSRHGRAAVDWRPGASDAGGE